MRKELAIPRFTSKLDRYLWGIHQNPEPTLMPLLSIDDPQAKQKNSRITDKLQLGQLHVDFQQLQELTQQLLQAQDYESAAKIALVGIEDVLQYSIAGVWLVNDRNTRLEPTSMTQEAAEIISTQPVYTQEQRSLSWQAFDSQTSRRIDSMDTHPDCYNAETQIKSELIVPIGKFGILNIGSTEPNAFSDEDLRRVEAWIGTVESAMDRLERITDLREREASLQRERKRLAEFAEIISHDLQNPLNIAVGYLTRAQNICSCEELEKRSCEADCW